MDTNISLVCFDMDGTLLKGNAWQSLNRKAGISDELDAELYRSFEAGTLLYSEWIATLNKNYRAASLTKNEVTDVLIEVTESLEESATETIEYLHNNCYQTALITGSFDITAEALATILGIKHFAATTTCEFAGEIFTGVASEGEESLAKARKLINLCKDLGIEMKNVAAVGDGGNDLEIFKLVGKSITFNSSSEKVRSAALHSIDSLKDLRDIL